MQVNPSNNVPEPVGVPSVQPTTNTQPERAEVDLAESSKLARALENVPAVRPDKVAQAKALIQDPAYPNDAVLGRVAGLLADHLLPPQD